MTIIEHDFGKNNRDTVRRFTKLITLEAQHEAKVLANPIPYLERATERLSQLEMALLDAARALDPQPGEQPAPPQMVEIDKAEYERLLRCKEKLKQAVEKL
ncbi:hypothetical protein [Methylovirgula sp. HY1]|uniref:hypothetical protein n=1 Tax=Methylovirgula sp. HY1 TaxID=2822761 RepID=UPI001C5ACDA9|nr:hypothetical protein [Methylovirgula sp. HY1]QXX75784.1 hypothetical protein MHY1_02615 [Methylovirgula sp. HY1]